MNAQTLALLGGEPAHTRPAPHYPVYDPEVFGRIRAALEAGPTLGLSKHHPVVGELEATLAEWHDVPHVLGANSGHGALHSALIGLEIGPGDHVLTSPYSWGASVSCILAAGAVPVFTDVDPRTGLIDPAKLGEQLTPQTRAILVPHIFGQPADMTAICAFAQQRGLHVIEDGSQAHGARHRGVRVGRFGVAAGFSVNGVKPIATTEGGYLLTHDPDVYWRVTISCQHAGRGELAGRASEPGFPDELRPYVDSLILSYRPNVVSALLTVDRLRHVDDDNAARRENAALLREQLAGVGSVAFPDQQHPDDRSAVHMVTLCFDAEHAGVSRDAYVAALVAEGVDALAYVPLPLHRTPRLSPDYDGPRVGWTEAIRASGIDPGATELPGCEAKVACSIELPWNLTTVDPDHVASVANAFVKVEQQLDPLRAHARASTPEPSPLP